MDKEVFTYRVTDWFGKEVKILKGKDAGKFLAKMNAANNQNGEQLIMAKVTGNFKRGNERLGKQNN
ncbi:hypothetical protein [Bacillus gobiensis]|uniref:hypothetical protein n=1 Tax=Bacillus gobiensis TaxID=1441095 RepID=UPI003D1C9986